MLARITFDFMFSLVGILCFFLTIDHFVADFNSSNVLSGTLIENTATKGADWYFSRNAFKSRLLIVALVLLFSK